MLTLKHKVLNGVKWNFVDLVVGQGFQFIIGILLARILSPKEFGLIGILAIFISISQSFVESGFGSALIRKKVCLPKDFSTVFIYNIFVSFVLYIILFFISTYISNFFLESKLSDLIKILGLGIIINAFSIIPRTILIKNVDFKTQAKISFISSIFSGFISILMALNGFGIWSLVALNLFKNISNTFLLWFSVKWEFSLYFSRESFFDLFSFGGKLFISGLLNSLFENFSYIIIGKYFSVFQLGQYTRAEQFNNIPSQSLSSIISKVSYPILVTLQDDKIALKKAYRIFIKKTMFLTFLLMFLLSVISYPLIFVLIGQKWALAAEYLQILCFVGMMYPLHSINLNLLKVVGRSDLFLKLEIIKKFLLIPTLFFGYYFGVKILIIITLINSFFAYFINSYWSGKFINYSIKDQCIDILPSMFFASIIACIVYFISQLLTFDYFYIISIQLISAISLIVILGELLSFNEYIEFKKLFLLFFKKN